MITHKLPNYLKKVSLVLLPVIAVVLLLAIVLVATLLITEYKPADTESIPVNGVDSNEIAVGDSLTVMTWNIGYGALGDYADFFMDGGKSVSTSTKEQVNENMSAISTEIKEVNPDVVFLQEVDQNSKRSFYLNETNVLADSLQDYQYTFANNFKVLYVPYPIPTIGKVDSGILTFSNYEITSSTRQSLPCLLSAFTRMANLKRCITINRVDIEGSDKELVLVNIHLEAYDNGEGKEAQTKLLKQLLQDESEKGNYVIAGGDFNQSFSNISTDQYPVMSEEYWKAGEIDTDAFGTEWQFVADNTVPTCRSLDKAYAGSDKELFQYYMLDGFIVSSNLTVNTIETKDLQFKNSDHNPLVMNVTLKDN